MAKHTFAIHTISFGMHLNVVKKFSAKCVQLKLFKIYNNYDKWFAFYLYPNHKIKSLKKKKERLKLLQLLNVWYEDDKII